MNANLLFAFTSASEEEEEEIFIAIWDNGIVSFYIWCWVGVIYILYSILA
jgi:hypothetical protein